MSKSNIDFSTAVAQAASCVATPHTADDLGNVKLASKWQYVSGSALWTLEEENILAQALEKYRGRIRLDRYILIASELPSKSVRDVAHKLSMQGHKVRPPKIVHGSGIPSTCTAPLRHAVARDEVYVPGKVMEILDSNSTLIQDIRKNLMSGRLDSNVRLMNSFSENTDELLNTIASVGIEIPALSVSVNTKFRNFPAAT